MLSLYESTVKATIAFLKLLKIRVTSRTVNETLQNHPDFPSILSISDSLHKWNLPNAAGRINKDNIEQLPLPFLAHMNDKDACFIIVIQITETNIYFYHPGLHKTLNEPRNKFLAKWNGIYLIAEPGEASGEADYKKKKWRQPFKLIVPSIAVLLLLFGSITDIVKTTEAGNVWNSFSKTSIYLQYFIFVCGIAVTTLLLWHEVDRENPLLKKLCTITEKTSCDAVLGSKHAKPLPWISWSEIGFIYFTGGSIALLFSKYAPANIVITGWLALLVTPYICFSLYYQWKIVKQWCLLCLVVQILLLAGMVNSLLGGFIQSLPILPAPGNSLVILAYVFPCAAWFSVKPYIYTIQKNKRTRREYLRIKFNEEIFDTLLKKQPQIIHPTEGIGIVLGNKSAGHELVKVCNPYCGPCSQAHPEIEKLLDENNNIKVRIIFTATTNEKDRQSVPVKHLLAIASNNDEKLTKKALDDWYMADKKDYNVFAGKYPGVGELQQQNEKIKAMEDWCRKMEISVTPTFFVRGHKLPDAYSIGDLSYFLSE